MSDETKATNVIEALARVVRDMPGIGKDNDSSQGYKYRGIEAITRETQGLLGKHGVVFVPEVVSWETDQLTVNNKPWTDTKLRVLYRVYGPGGPEDVITVGPVCAIGRDNSDKGANKAMTQAFKYALLQTLCIGDAKDDGDQASHEADSRHEAPTEPLADHGTHETIRSIISNLPDEAVAEFRDWYTASGFPPISKADRLTERQATAVLDHLDELDSPLPQTLAEAGETQGPSNGPPGPQADTASPAAAPASPEPLVKPASRKPSAAARAALAGEKPALGAIRSNEPVADEDVQAHFPGSEVVAS